MIEHGIIEAVRNSAAIQTALGGRVYGWSDTPPANALERPYAVWQYIAGDLDACVSGEDESLRIQFDVYADTAAEATSASQALEYAMQRLGGETVSYGVRAIEPDTRLYRVSFDMSFMDAREWDYPTEPPVLPPDNGDTFERIAGTTVSALRAVWEDRDGTVRPLSPDDDGHIDLLVGITTTSAAAGDAVTIQRAGPLNIEGLPLTLGRVWLGAGGQLTATPPEEDFDTLLGFVVAGQRMYIQLFDAIELEA